ncbi:MAG: ABC transporter ATP-binding protein [Planctomycetota bacterium]|nr:ABC transporter ATP-binding protein [Planctomycetota bacterium]
MSELRAEDLAVGYDGTTVLHGVSLRIAPGRITALLGPNGSGKSTLLKCMGRLMRPWKGRVLLGGRPLPEIPTREAARILAVLPQQPVAPPELTVSELVGYGRYPHVPWHKRFEPQDFSAIGRALDACALRPFAKRRLATLSGGERQRAWLAMALAQEPRVLLLDEPITFLDIAHQLELLELLRALNRSSGLTIAMVLHDINLAARYADEIAILKSGAIHSHGPAEDVITPQAMHEVFGVRAERMQDSRTGAPQCHFSIAPAE